MDISNAAEAPPLTEKSKAPAIARAAAILRLLGKSNAPLGLHTIAKQLGLVPSTCLYVLRALTAEGFVAFDADTKRYVLDAGVLTLASNWLRRNRFADLVQPPLDRLGREFSATMLGVQIVGLDHIIVVATSQSASDFHLTAQIGSRFPALISATGRCIAAFGDYSEAELDERFHTLRWENPPTLGEWKAQVQQTRQQGYALDEGNYIAGVTVVAAPVWKAQGKLSHALVALYISSALKPPGSTSLHHALLAAAQSVSQQLGPEMG